MLNTRSHCAVVVIGDAQGGIIDISTGQQALAITCRCPWLLRGVGLGVGVIVDGPVSCYCGNNVFIRAEVVGSAASDRG